MCCSVLSSPSASPLCVNAVIASSVFVQPVLFPGLLVERRSCGSGQTYLAAPEVAKRPPGSTLFIYVLQSTGNCNFFIIICIYCDFVCAWPRKGGLCSGWLKPLRTELVPIYRASVISVRWAACTEPKAYWKTTPTTTTACSPCFHLERDTEVSAAVPPDSRAASFLRLWHF